MKSKIKNFRHSKSQKGLIMLPKLALMTILTLQMVTGLQAQSNAVSAPWDAFYISTTNPGSSSPGEYNWGSGVITLTDTTTNSGNCGGAAVVESSSTYAPVNSGAAFSQCYRAFFGCPGNDQIGATPTSYTDFNGDGMAFSFFKNGTAYDVNNGLACGGGLGYMGTTGGAGAAGTMITIEFDTYSSVGGSGFDANYGGGLVSPSINDEISVHVNGDASDSGILPVGGASVNAGNLEDGHAHDICITYTPGVNDGVLKVSIDGVNKLTISLGATYNLQSYFGSGTALNQSWSAGKYGANNFQTIGPAGANLSGTIGHVFCPGTLPVKLLTFTGELNKEAVVLNWATATESNNKKFIIERAISFSDSEVGNWQVIGEVAGAGNSSFLVNYNFTDYAPLEGIAYYRLRQIDIDGTSTTSNIVAVRIDAHYISIMPNPFEDSFSISGGGFDEMDIKIQDVLGRLVYQGSKKSENGTIRILPELQPGAYFITMQTEEFIEQRKIIRK